MLDEETWIIVDRQLNDVPVRAWLVFETKDRSLHQPVNYTRNMDHAHANIIQPRLIEAMTLLLDEKLAELENASKGSISSLTRKQPYLRHPVMQ